MNYCGIICEYNPLHNGHVYHIEQTRQALSPSAIICVMSGNFVQRGEPAIADKYLRAEWAVKAGADIVIELPAVFAVSPAENFAYGAVRLLSCIKGVKHLSFGSELGDIDKIKEFARETQKTDIRKRLASGYSYASSFAAEGYSSNNILGAEYVKAIEKLGGGIVPFTLKREGGAYASEALSGKFPSATAVRKCLESGNGELTEGHVPHYVLKGLQGVCPQGEVFERLFFMAAPRLIEGGNTLEKTYGVTEGLHNRITAAAKQSFSYRGLIESIKTRRYPSSKIKRVITSALLGITANDVEKAKKSPPYARVLALRAGREDILSEISKDIKTIARASDYFEGNICLEKDIFATEIYAKLTLNNKLRDFSAGLKIIF